jgi:hypothetical protein
MVNFYNIISSIKTKGKQRKGKQSLRFFLKSTKNLKESVTLPRKFVAKTPKNKLTKKYTTKSRKILFLS